MTPLLLLSLLSLIIDGNLARENSDTGLPCSKVPVFVPRTPQSLPPEFNESQLCLSPSVHDNEQYRRLNSDSHIVKVTDGRRDRNRGGHIGGHTNFFLTVLVTSDLHGHFRQISRLTALKNQLQSRGDSVILLDLGHVSVGSAFNRYYGMTGTHEMMQVAGYDALSVGKHDHVGDLLLPSAVIPTNGKQEEASRISLWTKGLPVLSLSHFRDASRSPESPVLPSTVVNASGLRVGLIGISRDSDTAQVVIDEAICLKVQGAVNLVVLLAHGGLPSDLLDDFHQQLGNVVDVVIVGGTRPEAAHISSATSGSTFPHHCNPHKSWHACAALPFIVPAAYNAKYFSKITIVGKQLQGDVSANDVNRAGRFKDVLEVAVSSTLEDPSLHPAADDSLDISKLLLRKRREIMSRSAETSEKVFEFDENDIPVDRGRNCRAEPCFSGRIIVSAIMQHFNCSAYVLFKSGSIREKIHWTVTEASLRHTLPGNFSLVRVHMPADVLREALQRSISSKGSRQYLQAAFPTAAGVRDCSFGGHSLPAGVTGIDDVVASIPSNGDVDVIMTEELLHEGFYDFTRVVEVVRTTLSSREVVKRFFFHHPHSRDDSSSDLLAVPDSGSARGSLPAVTGSAQNSGGMVSEPSLLLYEGVIALVSECLSIAATFPLLSIDFQPQSTGKQQVQPEPLFLSLALYSLRVLSSAVYWPIYYNILRLYHVEMGVGSIVEKAKRGFVSSLLSGGIVTLCTNPYWAAITRMKYQDATHPLNCDLLNTSHFDNLLINMLLVIVPSLKMFFFEFSMVLVQRQLLAHHAGYALSAVANGLCGCVASMASTAMTYPLQRLRPKRHQTNLYENRGLFGGGFFNRLLASATYDFVSFFSYKIFYEVANVSPYE
mmetsp:Transcript_15691/g.26155  ORF Transcript_15691/g.26155 Transcript_15691/m.26155 type:complete len:884 (-) Transcript_15691:181-2832(-)